MHVVFRAAANVRTDSHAPPRDHGEPITPVPRDPRDWQTFQSLEVCVEYLDELRENLQPSPARGLADMAPQTIDDLLRDVIRCERRVVQVVDIDEDLSPAGSCAFSRFRWRMEHGMIQMAYGNGCGTNKHILARLAVMHKVRARGSTPIYVHSVCRRCAACCFLRVDILAGTEPLAPLHGDMLQELKDTMNSLQQTVSTMQRTVDDHSTRIEDISSASAPAADGDIEKLQSNIATCSQKLETAMTTLSAQAGRIDGIATTTQAAHGSLSSLVQDLIAKVNAIPLPFPVYGGYNNIVNAASTGTGAQLWTPQPQVPTVTPTSSVPASASAPMTQANSQPTRTFASMLQPTKGMPQHTSSTQHFTPTQSIFLQNIPAATSSDNPSSTAASHGSRQPEPPPSPARDAAQAMISMANSEEQNNTHARAGKRAKGR